MVKGALANNSAEPVESAPNARERALLSQGASDDAIYAMVARELTVRPAGGGTIVDVGCGSGRLFGFVGGLFERYVGVDVIAYDGFPRGAEFVEADLEHMPVPLADRIANVVVAVETIEHLENPRAFMRELMRLVRPGGWVAVTTPNQLSLMSKLKLVVSNEFPAFQEGPGLYPAHISALIEVDLVRMAREAGACEMSIAYSNRGRIPLTPRRWPRWCRGRAFSDNIMIIGRKARAAITPGAERATFGEGR